MSIFSRAYWPLKYTFFGEMPIHMLCPVFNWAIYLFLLLNFKNSWLILDTTLLSDIWSQNIFSHLWAFYCFTDATVGNTKVFNFNELQFIYILLSFVLLVLYLKNRWLNQGHEDLLLFSSKSFLVLGLSFRSMIHSVHFCVGYKKVSNFLCEKSLAVILLLDIQFYFIDLSIYLSLIPVTLLITVVL